MLRVTIENSTTGRACEKAGAEALGEQQPTSSRRDKIKILICAYPDASLTLNIVVFRGIERANSLLRFIESN
jgi:hypothetical protein